MPSTPMTFSIILSAALTSSVASPLAELVEVAVGQEPEVMDGAHALGGRHAIEMRDSGAGHGLIRRVF